MSQRLFVALRPPADVRAALLAVMGGIEGAHWQTDGQLHLTLAFLGTLDRHGVAVAIEALSSIHQSPFGVRLGTVGSFSAGRENRVSTLWVSVSEDKKTDTKYGKTTIFNLASSCRQALRGAGLEVDSRRFLPHITVARFGRAGAPRDLLRRWLADVRLPALPFEVDRFHLVESHMGAGGSHYVPLASYQLEGAAVS